jgi:hypothetical protein
MTGKVLALSLAAALAVACAPRAPRTVSMRMVGSPPNATVTIDDQFVGTLDVVARRGVALPPGSHRVSVEAAGYLPWDRIVEATEGSGPVRLDVQLTRVPD